MAEEDSIRLDDEKISGIVKSEQNNDMRDGKINIKVYKRRWFILALYIFFSSVSGQGVQYVIISNILSDFYNVSVITINWTAAMGRFFFLIFILPMTYMEQKLGLRRTMILGSFLSCLGSWIKTFSATPDGFYITFIGHSIVALTVVMVISLPGRVSALWFGSDQLSTATMLGVFGPQFGTAATFLLTPMLVKKHDNLEETGAELLLMFRLFAIGTSINFVLCLLFFQEEPKFPPTETRAFQKSNQLENKEGFFVPMKRLFTNKSYLIFCNTYGVNVGIFDTICVLLNPLIIEHFEDGEEDAGRIGMIISLTGMFGAILLGRILDKTHKFKETTVIVYFLTFISQGLFSIAMFMEIKWMIYVSAIFLGFFMSGYLALGYEMASEFTYPESEVHSSGILNIFSIVYGIGLLYVLGLVMKTYGDIPVHVILCLSLLIGTVVSAMTRDVQRRHDAKKSASSQVVSKNVGGDKDSQV